MTKEPEGKMKKEGFLEAVNESLFNEKEGLDLPGPLFPLFLYVTVKNQDQQSQDDLINWEILRQFKVKKVKSNDTVEEQEREKEEEESTIYEIKCLNTESRNLWEELIYKLDNEPLLKYCLDYSHFISHPGVIFIKNLSIGLVNETEAQLGEGKNGESSSIVITKENSNSLFQYLLENSHFKSLKEIKIFTGDVNVPTTPSNSTFAIVRFDNYIDSEIIISKLNKLVPNIFNHDQAIPLYLNKYLNKRERSSNPLPTPVVPENPPSYQLKAFFDIIFIENLNMFLPTDSKVSQVKILLDKITEFGCEIDSIYVPVTSDQKCLDYGYIKFKPNPKLVDNTLNVLYYLNNVTWLQLEKFDVRTLQPLNEEPIVEDVRQQDGLCLTIAQYKHNQYLYSNSNNDFLCFKDNSTFISGPNLELITHTFSRTLNYQETNIYVNNLPIIFNNDDELWESFWRQFGIIKSAKIIKPQFYRGENAEKGQRSTSGRIGFVFYNDFKMAIKAILLTNSKIVNLPKSENYHSHPVLIQSSFALQKSNARSGLYKAPPYFAPEARLAPPKVPQGYRKVPTVPFQPRNAPAPQSPYFNPYYMYSRPGASPPVFYPVGNSPDQGQPRRNIYQNFAPGNAAFPRNGSRRRRESEFDGANYQFSENVGYPSFPYNISPTYYYEFDYEEGYRSS